MAGEDHKDSLSIKQITDQYRLLPIFSKRYGVEFFSLPVLAQSFKIRHAFFTRKGGVSKGIYASLNCGYQSLDLPAAIAENYHRACSTLSLNESLLVKPYQTHSNKVTIINRWPLLDTDLCVDGLVTTLPKIILSIITADCAPVLLVDEKAGIIGACHAGWRGTYTGIIESTLAAMIKLGAKCNRVHAGIGPCIGPCSYKVGKDVFHAFVALNQSDSLFFNPLENQYWLMDLAGLIAKRLKANNVKNIEIADADSYLKPDDFFSYRYNYHHGLKDCGRLVSLISLLE